MGPLGDAERQMLPIEVGRLRCWGHRLQGVSRAAGDGGSLFPKPSSMNKAQVHHLRPAKVNHFSGCFGWGKVLSEASEVSLRPKPH